MPTFHRLSFEVTSAADGDAADGPSAVVPLIDGRSLIDLVDRYEASRGFNPAGGYGGLVPRYFDFGDLRDHFRGRSDGQCPSAGHAWVLACDCGDVGCWPLTTRIVESDDTVSWLTFSQDHRPQRDYSGFGPFTFERAQFDGAVTWLVAELQRRDR